MIDWEQIEKDFEKFMEGSIEFPLTRSATNWFKLRIEKELQSKHQPTSNVNVTAEITPKYEQPKN